MAWPSAYVWKFCALDLAAAGALAATVLAHVPAPRACTDPLAGPAGNAPGFSSLSAPEAPPACLRIRLR